MCVKDDRYKSQTERENDWWGGGDINITKWDEQQKDYEEEEEGLEQ